LTGALYRVRTDGASRGNPGPAAIGVAIEDAEGREIASHSEAIGTTTNNVAEYRAVVQGLTMLAGLGASRAEFLLDSELVVRQLNGQYRVKDPKMAVLYAQVRRLAARLGQITFRHIPRHENQRADQLANEALDRARAD
jgi:ribonuclease HI